MKGQLDFSCSVIGDVCDELDPFEVQSPDSRVSKITIAAPHPGNDPNKRPVVKIAFHFDEIGGREQAIAIAEAILTNLLNVLVMERKIGIIHPGRCLWSSQDNSGNMTGEDFITFTETYRLIRKPELEGLKARLNGPPPANPRLAELFRVALLAENVIEKYLALYQVILVKLNDPSIGKMDDWLNREFGDALTPRPDNSKICETVYSKVRSQIAHCRGVDREETRRQMESLMEGLMIRVVRAIETP